MPKNPEKFELKREETKSDEGLEKGAQVIKNFFQKECPIFIEAPAKKFFLGLSSEQFKKILGERAFQLIDDLVSERNTLKEQMLAGDIKKAKVRKIIREKGNKALPYRVRRGFEGLSASLVFLSFFLQDKYNISQGKISGLSLEMEQKDWQYLSDWLYGLKTENKEWKDRLECQREGEEKPTKIEGFEKFNFPGIKGNEIVELAKEILPTNSFPSNIERIEYIDEIRPMPKEYGIEGYAGAETSMDYKTEKDKVCFFKRLNTEKEHYLKILAFNLNHEWGHSLDPRLIDQKDLSPLEQLKLIEDWEKVRSEEPPFSFYVKKIKNSDKKREDLLKSKEDWAESIGYLLENHFYLERVVPKRYQFFLGQLEKRFPGFDLEESSKKIGRYQFLIRVLETGKKDLVNKFLKEVFEKND